MIGREERRFRPLGCALVLAAFLLVDASGVGARNGPQRTISVGDVRVVEGDVGTQLVTFDVVLDAPAPDEGIRLAYETDDGSATAAADYMAASGIMTFPAGGPKQAKTISVPVVGDATAEGDEVFRLVITDAKGATIEDAVALATIVDDDAPAPSPPPSSIGEVVTETPAGSSPDQLTPSLTADLSVAVTAEPRVATVGQQITFTTVVSNRGPSAATNVTIVNTLPPGLAFASATVDQGSCTGAATVTCEVGTLAVGQTVTLRVLATAGISGQITNTVRATATETDPDPVNNAFRFTAQVTPLKPVQGRLVVGRPVRGVVLVNGQRLVRPRTIRVGSRIDTTRGTIDLQATTGRARFRDGRFSVLQKRRRRAVAVLRLTGGRFAAVCSTRSLSAAGRPRRPNQTVRHLWGDGNGRFRTEGKYASATVRGTIWLVEDRCDGTLVRVRRGRVAVFDIPRRTTVVLGAGETYLARAP